MSEIYDTDYGYSPMDYALAGKQEDILTDMGDGITHLKRVIADPLELITQTYDKLNYVTILFALATLFSVFNLFPDTPKIITYYNNKYPFIRWFAVFVLVWQGGGEMDLHVSIAMTIVFYIIYQTLKGYDTKAEELEQKDKDKFNKSN
jgi:hypothetical protein